MHQRFSLHKINDPLGLSFNPAEYSRFKFGDYAVARKFGYVLAQAFIKHTLHLAEFGQLVVLSSPYSFIPTASFALKNHFVAALNRWLAVNNKPVCEESKVHRSVTYKDDYGNLSATERLQLISKDSFHVDRTFLKGKTLIFIDDIRITGSHESMILKMAAENELSNTMYLLYFAELINPKINPNIENYLNYFEVKNLFDLNPIISSPEFFINTRVVKYILNTEETSFRVFMSQHERSFLEALYDLALGNQYHTMHAYQGNLKLIADYLYTSSNQTPTTNGN